MSVKKVSVWDDLTVTDVVSNVFVEGVTLVAVFFVGAMVGSFVNVVLYRAPRRMNLFWPPSRCPRCGKRLKLFHNVPVAGWLSLKGKCKFCKAPIPKSYLKVEVGFGLLFLAVMYAVTHTGGWTLPLRGQESYFGALWTIWYPRPELLRIWGHFTLLAAALTVFGLFIRRNERLPGLYALAALLAGALMPVWVNGLQQVPWQPVPDGDAGGQLWATAGWVEAAVGLAVGAVVGFAFRFARPARMPLSESRPWLPLPAWLDSPVLFAVAGAWLGWQAVVSVAVLAAVGLALFRRSPPAAVIVGATAVQFLLWRLLADFAPWWPGPRTAWWLHPVWAAAVAVGVVANRLLSGPIATPLEGPPEASPPPSPPPPELATPAADSPAGS
jgi:leader peptidase (prepilin peptidase) / N-methyltransferase